MEKIAEEMWCYKCDGTWQTDDYFAVDECPHCGSLELLYRTSSFAYFYAYLSRHPEEKKRIHDNIAAEKAKFEAQKAGDASN